MPLTFAGIVPTHNRSRLLRETVASFLTQNRKFDELIVVDDGSADDTAAVMGREYPQCRFIALPAGHVQRARNAGLAAASSDWVVFSDDDDLLTGGYLSQIEQLITSHTDLDIIYTNHTTFGDGDAFDRFATVPPEFWDLHDIGPAYVGDGPGLAAKLVGTSLLWPSGMAVRRGFIDRIGPFDVRMAGLQHEDFEFTVRAVAGGKAAFVKAPLVRVRQHASNFGSAHPLVRARDAVIVLQFCLDHHPHAQADPLHRALQVTLEVRQRDCLYQAYRQRDWATLRTMAAALAGKPLDLRQRLKIAIARLPEPISNRLHQAMRPLMT